MNNSQIEIRKKRLELLSVSRARAPLSDADGTIYITGLVTPWDVPSDDTRAIPFMIRQSAFDFVDLKDPDIEFRLGHETPICSFADGTLSLRISDAGLHYSASLPACDGSRWLKSEIDAGRLSSSSIGISGVRVREVIDGREVDVFHHVTKLTDVSVVDRPGNSKCTVFAFDVPVTAEVDNRSVRRRNRKPLAGFAGFLSAHHLLPAFRDARRQGLTVQQLAGSGMPSMQWAEAKMYVADKSEACGWRYVGR